MPPENLIGNAGETTETSTEETSTETSEQTTTETTTTEDGVSTEESTVVFPEGLDADIAKDPSLQVFVKDGKINYANMMKSYVHAQKQMGADKVILPTEKSSPEEWEAFHNKMGRPELDKYELKSNLEEGQALDEDMLKDFKTEAHKAGLMPKQAQNLLDWFNTKTNEAGKSQSDINQVEYDKQVEGLKKEWGEGYERELTVSDNALKQFATPEEIAYLNERGITSDVNVVRLFNKIGKGLSEDTFDEESKGSFGMTPDEAQAKINSHMADSSGAYMNRDHADHKRVVAEVLKLNEVIANVKKV